MRAYVCFCLVALFELSTSVVCPPRAFADDVYLTKDEALKIVLGEGCDLSYEKRELTESDLDELKRVDAAPDGAPESHVFTCRRGGEVTGYAFIDQQIGKHAPITFVVGISPSGAVTGAEVMVYREHYGSQVKGEDFLSQFAGKSGADTIRVGKDIKHISGATLSSLALAKGVRREITLWRLFFSKQTHA